MPADPQRVQAVFVAAIEVPEAAARAALLDRECGDDAKLRQRVEELLRAHDQPGSFLDPPEVPGVTCEPITPGPGIDTADTPALMEGPGTRIGPYKLLQQIGEGGFGIVYMAEQEQPVRRKVALKIIKPGMDSAQVIARFEAERQALALMDHQNIARVLDAGTTASGRPYFVMELVKGVPITKFCDDNHLTPRERLELFVPICQAIQHAHQKGIIHRDVKPSNVLVTLYDGRPVPKVIDFGVAKAISGPLTERTLFTQLGQVVGTVEYMSPEQAEVNALDIDTRSDIYSLGVLLYELLTGSTPLEKHKLRSAAFTEMLRMIREEEPPKPSTRLSTSADRLSSISARCKTEPARLAKLVRGELDWIVMKALEKDRGRRYETANGFARDIQRYLADEAVEACPPRAAYRLRKFARKNRKALATAAAFVLLLAAAAVVSTGQAIRASRAETKALKAQALEAERANAERAARLEETAAKEREEAQRRRAETNFAKARAAVDDYLTKISESQLLQVPGMQPLRRELLRSALAFYDAFLRERAGDPTIQADLASAYFRVGRVQADLGASMEADRAYRQAVGLLAKLVKDNPSNLEYKADLARGYFYTNNLDQAIALGKELVVANPANARFRRELANTFNKVACDSQDSKEQLQAHQEALTLREALARENPDDPDAQADLGGTLNNLGVVLANQGRAVEARDYYLRAVEHGQIAFEKAPWKLVHGSNLAIQIGNVASMYRSLGEIDEAIRWCKRAVRVRKQLAEDNPAAPYLWESLLEAYQTITGLERSRNRPTQAARWQRLARAALERIPRESASNLYLLARVRAQCADAIGWGKKALTNEERSEQQRDADLAMDALHKAVAAGLTDVEKLKNDGALAILHDRPDYKALLIELPALVRQAATAQVASQEKRAAAGPNNRQLQADVAASEHALGVLHLGQGDTAAAVQALGQALGRRERLVQDEPTNPIRFTDLAETEIPLGELHWRMGRLTEGAQYWKRARENMETGMANLDADSTGAQQALAGWRILGFAYVKAGLWAEAAAFYDRPLKPDGGPSRREPRAGDDWFHPALLHLRTGDIAGYRRACAAMRALFGKSDKCGVYLGGVRMGLAEYTWACALDNRAEVHPAELVEQAEKIVAANPREWPRHILALACYRVGRFEDALVQATESNAHVPWLGRNMNWPLLAMIHHRLGHAVEARKWLEQANQEWRKRSPLAQSVAAPIVLPFSSLPWWQDERYWQDWPIYELLLAEANTLILGTRGEADCLDLLHRAYLHTKLGETRKADEEFQAAVSDRSKEPSAWLARGRVYRLLGDQEHAKADFAKAYELNPKHPQIQKEYRDAGGRVQGGR